MFRFYSRKPRRLDEKGLRQLKSCLEDFAAHVEKMFDAMNQATTHSVSAPFTPGWLDWDVAQDSRVRRAPLKHARVEAELAYDCLRAAQNMWPQGRRTLREFRTATETWLQMLDNMLLLNDLTACDPLDNHKVRQCILKNRRLGQISDPPMYRGLAQLADETGIEILGGLYGNMKPATEATRLASIHVEWDTSGFIRHELASDWQLTDYQVEDGLAASVPMLVAHQLAVLPPVNALQLCSRLLSLLDTGPCIVASINSSLIEARMDVMRGNSVFLTFHPTIQRFAHDGQVVPAVMQLLYNYTGHILERAPNDFPLKIRGFTLMAMLFYLDCALPLQVKEGKLDGTRSIFAVDAEMRTFSVQLYSLWEGSNFTLDKFRSNLAEAYRTYDTMSGIFGTSAQ